MFGTTLAQITADACVPEQLAHYVHAVSGRQGILCAQYAAYIQNGRAVLVAYPGDSQAAVYEIPKGEEVTAFPAPCLSSGHAVSLAEALQALEAHSCSQITVLSPFIPPQAPEEAGKNAKHDCYWQLPLPLARPGVKLRNMLTRAHKELTLHEERWGGEHDLLVAHYLATRQLEEGTRSLFSSLKPYVNGEPEAKTPQKGNVILLAARRHDMSLAGCSIGDFTGLSTAFYMFSFRYPDAPPGTADLLLSGLVRKAEEMGHRRMNLGLGINSGISFFKKKWGAIPYLPYVETSWEAQREDSGKSGLQGLLRRLFR